MSVLSAESSFLVHFCADYRVGEAVSRESRQLGARVVETLDTAKAVHTSPISQCSWVEKYGITFPLMTTKMKSSSKYSFAGPEKVFIVDNSSVALHRAPPVRVFVYMPRSLFRPDDLVGPVYSLIRAHFMCSCAIILKQQLGVKCNWAISDSSFPILRIRDDSSLLDVLFCVDPSWAESVSSSLSSEFIRHVKEYENEKKANKGMTGTTRDAATVICLWAHNKRLKGISSLFVRLWLLNVLETLSGKEKQDVQTVVKAFFTSLLSETPSHFPDGCPTSISSSTLTRMHAECESAVWNVARLDGMESLFTPSEYSFDQYLQIVGPSTSADDTYGSLVSFVERLEGDINRSMAERFEEMDIEVVGQQGTHALDMEWSMASPHPSVPLRLLLSFRVSSKWDSPLTIGPVANLPEAREFRAFWNAKSEMRKFADGRICETMVWSDVPSPDVPVKIIDFLMKSHYEGSPVSWRSPPLGPSDCHVERVQKAFGALSEMFRGLSGLPLTISNIHQVSPYVRGTEPQDNLLFVTRSGGRPSGAFLTPAPDAMTVYRPTVDVHIKLEYSGKWGDDENTINVLNTAFHVQICKQMRKKFAVTAVPFEDDFKVIVNDVVFRVYIMNGKLWNVLKKEVEKLRNAGAPGEQVKAAENKLHIFEKRFVSEQQLASSLHGICSSNCAFPPAVRIFKRWIGARLLSTMLDDMVVEMLVSHSFLSASPPRNPLMAFHRVLSLLTTHNWLIRPLILDYSKEWTDERISSLEASFVKMRPVLPPMVIITNNDEMGSKWTRGGPTALVLSRLIAFAGSTLQLLNRNISSGDKIDIENAIMSTDFSVFDGIINIDEGIRTRDLPHTGRPHGDRLPTLDFDPVELFVHSLTNHFGSILLFFYNRFDPSRIAFKFKPNDASVTVNRAGCKRRSNGQMVVNREEVLEGIRLLGQSIITHVQVN